jgi:DNA polymerase zeta
MCRNTILSVEILCKVRQNFLPNPKYDSIEAIFWVVEDCISNSESESTKKYHGIICEKEYNDIVFLQSCGLPKDFIIQLISGENELLLCFVELVNKTDPDFFVGYEIQGCSFGYIIKRGKILGIDMLQLLSKMPTEKFSVKNDFHDLLADDQESGFFITGRIIINLWHRMRAELKLVSYSYSNVAAKILSRRVPFFSHAQLYSWFMSNHSKCRTVRHLNMLSELNIYLMQKIDMIRRISESARFLLSSFIFNINMHIK